MWRSTLPEPKYLTVSHLKTRILVRLFSNIQVDSSTKCWLWTGELNHAGYGKFFYNGKKIKVHRLTYAWLIEALPEGGPGKPELDHVVCNTRRCCNPCHVKLGPHADNMSRSRKACLPQRTPNVRESHLRAESGPLPRAGMSNL